jgi:hypothetical protein
LLLAQLAGSNLSRSRYAPATLRLFIVSHRIHRPDSPLLSQRERGWGEGWILYLPPTEITRSCHASGLTK